VAQRPDARRRRRALGLAAVLCMSLSACDATLYESLPEIDARRVVAALERAGVTAQLSRARAGHYRVEVASTEVHRAIAELTRELAVRGPAQAGFEEVFGAAGLVPTPSEERARANAATAGEIARTLERHPGIESARVHLSPPRPPEQLDDATTGRSALAWVLLAPRSGDTVVSQAVVASTVAGSVPGLSREAVTVQLQPAGRTAAGLEPPRLVKIGPLAVAPSSLPALRAILGGSLALNAVLALAIAVVWRRRGRP